MVDDETGIGMAVDQHRARIHIAPAQYVDRKVVLYGRAQDSVEARIIRVAVCLLRHHDADTDRARCLLPVGDDIAHGWIVWIDWLDDCKLIRMGPLHFHRITRVVAIHRKGRDEDRAVDADLVHRPNHLITRNVIRPVRHTVPWSLWGIRLIGVDLGVDDRHRKSPHRSPQPQRPTNQVGCDTERNRDDRDFKQPFDWVQGRAIGRHHMGLSLH
jgi:hypothetical protein